MQVKQRKMGNGQVGQCVSGTVLSVTGLSGRMLSGRLQVRDDQGLQCEPMEAGLFDCTHRQRLEVHVLVHLHASKHTSHHVTDPAARRSGLERNRTERLGCE